MTTGQTFRPLPFMGVIHVNNEAMKAGWIMGDPNWSNLGQGQPEVGDIPDAPARFSELKIDPSDHAYGPVEGIPEYRQAVADHYNRLYRKGQKSQYTLENVMIAPGGRAALARVGAALGVGRLGYFTPDYTAYEDMLTTFSRVEPVWIELAASRGFRIEPSELEARVEKDKLGALLVSNPCNPTGVAIRGKELAAWLEMSRRRGTTLLFDEFYSHYHYTPGTDCGVSAAEFVEDVDADHIVIVDGLTKCFRYPGWRSGWVLAPKGVIRTLTAAGSFMDGGPSRPMQRAAIEVLKPDRADKELAAVRKHFRAKRDMTLAKLKAMGVKFPAEPEGTFYAWGDVSGLPAPINTGEGFMRRGFQHRALTVPGEFFDVNPHKKRGGKSPLSTFVRFSFGPPVPNLTAGLDRLAEMVKSSR